MNRKLTVTIYKLAFLLIFLCSLGFGTSQLNAQQCPVIQAFPLQDVPGFPQTDSLVLCGVPDTIAALIFPSPIASYPNGINVSFELPAGMQYGGFVGLSFPGPLVSEADVSDPENPTFLIENVGPGQVVSLYIAVEGNCELVPPEDAPVNLIIDYVADLAGQLSACRDEIRPLAEYNSAYRIPVVNILGGAPVVNGECVLTFGDFTTEYCDTLIISQDGIEAYIDSFSLYVDGLDLVNLNLTRIEINDMNFDTNDPNIYQYDPVSQSARLQIGENFFTGNFDPNGLPSETDLDFNVNEQVTAAFCFTANDCASTDGKIITFGATYNCYERQCFSPSEKEVALNFTPAFAPEPIVRANVIQNGGICGDDFIVDFEVESDLGGMEGLYQDIQLRVPLCGGAEQIDGEDPELEGLEPSRVLIFNFDTNTYVPLVNSGTTTGEASWAIVNDAIQINWTGSNGATTDYDGNGGLDDVDGDGLFDDLPGDATLMIRVEYAFVCSDQASRQAQGDCGSLVCSVENVEVQGLRSCGQPFQQTTGIQPGPLNYIYGAIDVSSNAGPTANLTFGYQYAGVGVATPSVDPGQVGDAISMNMTHGYQFQEENIVGCTNAETMLELIISGGPGLINDVEFVPMSASYDGTAIPDADVIQQTVVVAPGDTVVVIQINAGAVGNPLTGLEEFSYDLVFDQCQCAPRSGSVQSRIIETCADCPMECSVVKSCLDYNIWINAEDCNCVCPISAEVSEMYRLNTGFTDKTMTNQIDPTAVDLVDQRRLLPGDTMFVRAKYTINDIGYFFTYNRWFQFQLYHVPITEGINRGIDSDDTEVRQMPSLMNPRFSSVRALWVMRAGTTNMQPLYLPNSIENSCLEVKGGSDPYPLVSQGTVVNNGVQAAPNGGSEFIDGQEVGLEFSSEDPNTLCLDDWFANVNPQQGDMFFVDWWIKIDPNPGQDRSLPEIQPAFSAGYVGVTQAPSTSSSSQCLPPVPYELYNPGPIVVNSDVTLTADGCAVDVKNTYTMSDDVPDIWYANEYRPISGVAWTDITIPANLAYCGPMNILDEQGMVIGTVPDSQVSFPNMTQVNFGGTNYYIANPGETVGIIRVEDAEFTDGTAGLDVQGFLNNAPNVDPVAYAAGDKTLVNGTLPLLGVGFQADQCNFMLSYQLKRICQENVEAADFTSVVGSSYTTTENYLIGRMFGAEYYYDGAGSVIGWLGTDMGDVNNSLEHVEIPGREIYWPYAANQFNNFGEADFPSAHNGDCNVVDTNGVGQDNDGDGCPDNIYGVGSNPHNQLDTLILPNFVDNSANFPSLVVSTDFNLIADAQGADDINYYEVCAGTDGAADLTNLVSTVTVPVSVALLDIRETDENGPSLIFSLIGTNAMGSVYQVTHNPPGDILNPGECYRFAVLTELLFCPVGLDIPTDVLLTSNASCLAPELTAQLSAASEGACLSSSTTYEYLSEEADLQVEFFIPQEALTDIPLCGEFCIGGRVKNVKTSPLINIQTGFFLPNGLEFVPGSWEVAYPGGPINFGNGIPGSMVDMNDCMDTDAWVSVPDPQQLAPTRPRGNTYGFDWATDLLGQGGGVLDDVISNGLPGVSTTTAQTDSNKVSFRFRVRTLCDEFTSGTSVRFIASALDPCETTILSNLALTDPIIIEDANPIDFAQLLTIADPADINCGEMGTLNVSTINTSMTNSVTLGARQCLNIPTNGITYEPGSLVFLEPVGFDGMVMEEDILGPDGVTVIEKQVCFSVPDNLAPGEFYQVAFDFTLAQTVSCEQGQISVEIATVLEDQTCSALGVDCNVAVLNSVNPVFGINFLPPLDIENFEVTSACDDDPTTIVYAYMFDLTNPGPDFMNTVELDVIRDLDQDGMLDNFETDPMINPPLSVTVMIPVNLPMGGSTSVMGEINVPADIGCPAFLRVRQNSECACDETVTYIDGAIPEFFADLGNEQVLCPGSPLILEVCGDYAPSAGNDYVFTNGNGTATVNFMGSTVLILESDPIAGIDFSLMGDDVVATLNDGFGVDGAVDINLTVNQGFCQETYSVNVRAAPDLQIGPYAPQVVCAGAKSTLDLMLDAILEANASITWSPTTFLDDPTSPKPQICNPTSDIQYTVTVELNDSDQGCSGMATYDVQVLAPGTVDLTYTGETVCYDEMNPGVLTATSGFMNYTFYVLVGGSEFVVQDGTNNTYNVPGPGGTYFVRVDDGSQCGLVSAPVSAPGLPCGECPDIYNGVGPLEVCAGQSLDSIKVFTGSTAIDGIVFVVFDAQQINPDDIYNYSTTGGTVLGSTTPMVMTPDTMATIYDVSVSNTPGDYFIYAILNPTPDQASCRPLEEIQLTVNPMPVAGIAMDDVCEDANGMASFVLNTYDSMIDVGGGNTLTYHLTQMNADDNINAITSNPYMTSVDITLFVRVENPQGCYNLGQLILQANQLPMTPISGGDQQYCDGDTPPALGVMNPGTGFTIEWYTDANANTPVSGVSVGGFNNESITLTSSSSPALPTAGNSVTVYAQSIDDATGCISATRTPVTITNNPTPEANPAAMTVCEDEFQSRTGTFDLTTIVDDVNADFMEGGTATGGEFTSMSGAMTLSFHVNMGDAMSDTNPIPNPDAFMNTSLGSQTIFARIENEVGCVTIVQIQLSVAGLPDTDNLSLTVCPDIGSNNSSSGIDLTALEGTLASGNTPGSYTITWYENSSLTMLVADPTNVTVMDDTDFYAVIMFNNAPNCSNVASIDFQVDPLPPIIDISLELCEDNALVGDVANINLRDNDLTVASGMSAIVNWYEDMGLTIPVATPNNITLSMSGNGTEDNIFYAQVSDGNCDNRARVEFVIFQQAVVEAGGPYELCAGTGLSLSGASLSGSATMGAWIVTGMPASGDGLVLPMGLIADPSTAIFTATVPGNYTLTLTSDDPTGPCMANMDEVVITVHPLPIASPPTAEVCAGGSVTVDGTPTQGTTPYMTHQWVDLGTGTASGYSLVNPTAQVVTVDAAGVSNANAGTVNLEYTVTDANGCVDSGTTTVNIYPLPVPNPLPAMVCVGDAVMVDGAPTQGTTPYTLHQWTDLGTGTASNYLLLGTDMQVVTVDASSTMDGEAGTVILEYTVADVNGCMQSAMVTVTINPLPEITPMGGNITCTPPQEVQISASTTAASPMYMWDGPGIVAGMTTANPTVNLPGVYTVTVTDGMTGCMNTAQAFVTQDPLSKCLPATFEIRVKGGE